MENENLTKICKKCDMMLPLTSFSAKCRKCNICISKAIQEKYAITKERRTKIIQSKQHHCELCDFSTYSANLLDSHKKTQKHLASLMTERDILCCILCNFKTGNISNLQKHIETDEHISTFKRTSINDEQK